MNIVFTTESPPMTRASSAAAVVIAVKIAPPDLKPLTRSLGLVAFTPGTWALIRSASLSSSDVEVPGSPYTEMPSVTWVTSTAVRSDAGRLSRSSICPSARLMYAKLSGAVRVGSRIPTTVNV